MLEFQQLPRHVAELASPAKTPGQHRLKLLLENVPPPLDQARGLQGVCLLSSLRAVLDSACGSRAREPDGGASGECRGHRGAISLALPPQALWGEVSLAPEQARKS